MAASSASASPGPRKPTAACASTGKPPKTAAPAGAPPSSGSTAAPTPRIDRHIRTGAFVGAA
ncbi:hypothetical protein FKV24_018665 [Lysobacter maris]|uniref:Uncharacterized protein n=1 Tax=Marilutibacter maris TaxID=1605891 RepID=A0A507ZPS8_9GAMM|nr:hypothetical protein FKV24_018665 [Lysobacter maris]